MPWAKDLGVFDFVHVGRRTADHLWALLHTAQPLEAPYDRHTCAGCDASWVTVTLKKPGQKKGQEEAHVLAEFVRG